MLGALTRRRRAKTADHFVSVQVAELLENFVIWLPSGQETVRWLLQEANARYVANFGEVQSPPIVGLRYRARALPLEARAADLVPCGETVGAVLVPGFLLLHSDPEVAVELGPLVSAAMGQQQAELGRALFRGVAGPGPPQRARRPRSMSSSSVGSDGGGEAPPVAARVSSVRRPRAISTSSAGSDGVGDVADLEPPPPPAAEPSPVSVRRASARAAAMRRVSVRRRESSYRAQLPGADAGAGAGAEEPPAAEAPRTRRRSSSGGAGPHKRLVREMLAEVVQLVDSDDGWRLELDKKGVRVWRRVGGRATGAGASDAACVRAVAELPFSPREVYALLADSSRCGEYNDLLDAYDVLQRHRCAEVGVTTYKPVLFTSPREFVTLMCWAELPDGRYAIANRSVDHPGAPERPKFVRGRTVCAGYVIAPGSSGTLLWCIAQGELGGKIPQSIMNSLATRTPLSMYKELRRVLGGGGAGR